MNELSSFPGISLEVAEKIFEVSRPEFKYTRSDTSETVTSDSSLKLKEDDSSATSVILKDGNGRFDPDKHSLNVTWAVKIKEANEEEPEVISLKNLFDEKSKYACVSPKTDLGIAIQWYSWSSRQRGTVPFKDEDSAKKNKGDGEAETTTPNKGDGEAETKISNLVNAGTQQGTILYGELNLPEASLRGEVSFQLILFVKSIGEDYSKYPQYASEIGTVLGPISQIYTVILDGDGSELPIYMEDESGKPLWRLECTSRNPESDLFEDTVMIYINEADKKGSEMLKRSSKEFNPYLQKEIFAEILIELIEYIRSIDNDFNCLKQPEPGSVADYVNYHVRNNRIDLNDLGTVSRSVREYLMKI